MAEQFDGESTLSAVWQGAKGNVGALETFAHHQTHSGVTGYAGKTKGLLGASLGFAAVVGAVEADASYIAGGWSASVRSQAGTARIVIGACLGAKTGFFADVLTGGPIGAAAGGARSALLYDTPHSAA